MPRSLLLVTAGTLGDVLPAVALGRALAARGHRVRLACAPSLAGWLTGLEHVPVRPDLGPEAARRHTWAWDPAAPAARPEPGFGVEQHVHRIRDALPAAREADLLLTGSTVTGGRLLAELAGRPRLTFSATPAHYSPDHPGGRWRLGLLPADDPEAARLERLTRRLDAWLRQVFDRPPADALHDDAPAIVLGASPALHRVQAPPGHTLTATGAWLWTPPRCGLPASLARFLDRGPAALVQLGSQPVADPDAVLRPLLAALRAHGLRAVVPAGWADLRPEGEDTWSGEVTDHDALLPRVELVLTHGGAGTIERALRHGRPLAVLPFGNDQPYNARRVVALGAGVALDPRHLDAPDLPELLGRALRCAPAELQAALGQERGAEGAADAIEAAL